MSRVVFICCSYNVLKDLYATVKKRNEVKSVGAVLKEG